MKDKSRDREGGCLFWKGRIGPCSITVSSFRLYRYILVGKDTCLSPHLELLHSLTDSIHEQALLDSLTRCHHWLDFIFKGFAHSLGFRPWSAISLGHTLYPEAGKGHRLGFLIRWATGYPPLFSKVLAGISSWKWPAVICHSWVGPDTRIRYGCSLGFLLD